MPAMRMVVDEREPRAAIDVEMEVQGEEATSKRPRTVGSLSVEAFVEASSCMYEGLDQQKSEDWEPDIVREIQSLVADDGLDLLRETVVYDANTGKELPLDLVRKGRETEYEEMKRHGVFEEVPVSAARGKTVKFKCPNALGKAHDLSSVRPAPQVLIGGLARVMHSEPVK